jgi:hypothetical protein
VYEKVFEAAGTAGGAAPVGYVRVTEPLPVLLPRNIVTAVVEGAA